MQWCSWVGEAPVPRFVPLSSLPHALGRPRASALARSRPEDFRVNELLGFQPEGEGEHLLLHLRKRSTNTVWLAKQLARFAGVPQRDVGYAGLKDRNAVTSQWFSVRQPVTRELDWSALESDEVQLLEAVRHRRKLRRGALARNRFHLRLREFDGETDDVEGRLQKIFTQGIPNYFGEQRFGHSGNNLEMADLLFKGELKKVARHQRGIYLSAARSYLFNLVLAQRVEQGNWNRAMAGDSMQLDGRGSLFPVAEVDDTIRNRVVDLDIHPTGPLWGKGEQQVTGAVAGMERRILEACPEWLDGLVRLGLNLDRRALRARVIGLRWHWPAAGELELEFELNPGSYATMVLREIIVAR
jgi:tRNA pseudouridine13 synthase